MRVLRSAVVVAVVAARGAKTRPLRVEYGFHSALLDGCDEELTLAEIIGEGRTMLAGFVGEPLATLVFADLRRTLPKLTDLRTLREYLEEGLRVWLPK